MTSPVNPYGGDANVHEVPNYSIPLAIVDKATERLITNRAWYRFFQNISDSDEFPPSTVANLSTPTSPGARSFVSDATATTFYSIVAGGGANFVPVFWDGVHWRIG